jgi:protein TonB
MICVGFHQRPVRFSLSAVAVPEERALNGNSCCWTGRLPAWHRLCAAFILMALCLALLSPAFAQETRKVKSGNQPEYPDLARRNNIHGTARLQIVVAPDGSVKEIKVLGGNALLAQAAVDAVKKWKYEPAAAESTLVLKFDFK